MRDQRLLIATALGLALSSIETLAAPVIQVNAGIESSKFIDGLDISGGKPVANLAADVSFDNGAFAGLDCYKSENLVFSDGIDAGCHYYLGYFNALSNNQALSATLTRSEYAPTPGRQWDYTTAALSWHANRSTIFTLSAIDDWLGRGYRAIGASASYDLPLDEKWSLNLSAGYLDFETSAPTTSLGHATLGLRFEKGRWSSEINAHLSDDNSLSLLTPFSVERLDVSFAITYRLY